jgi:hypothetical protein
MLNLLCGGGHLGFSIDKNINFVQYHPIIIHVPSNTTTGHSVKIEPYGKMKKISQEIFIKPICTCIICDAGQI